MTRIPTPFLSVAQMQVAFSPDEFQRVVADQIGAGFVDDPVEETEALLLEQQISEDAQTFDDLDGFITDADFTAGAFDAGNITPVVVDTDATITAGNDGLNDLTGSIIAADS